MDRSTHDEAVSLIEHHARAATLEAAFRCPPESYPLLCSLRISRVGGGPFALSILAPEGPLPGFHLKKSPTARAATDLINERHAGLADYLAPIMRVSHRVICQFRIETAPSAHELLLLTS